MCSEETIMKSVLKGRDPTSQLYRAVIRYVESLGGSALVIGGVEIQSWPMEFDRTYRVAIRCTGKKPEKSNG
jgi:hypothetical protein